MDHLTRTYAHLFFGENREADGKAENGLNLQGLRLHAVEVLGRLIYVLDHLERSIEKLERSYNNDAQKLFSVFFLQRRGGIYADSVLHYLNALVDAIGRTVLLSLGQLNIRGSGAGTQFSMAKRAIKDLDSAGQLADSLRDCFSSLDDKNSWWDILFSRRVGLRQRIVHYPDTLKFQGYKNLDDELFRVETLLSTFFDKPTHSNFIGALKAGLEDMFAWLDKLDSSLLPFFYERTGADPPSSHDQKQWCIPLYSLIELSGERRVINGNARLYLPVCEDSNGLDCVLREGSP